MSGVGAPWKHCCAVAARTAQPASAPELPLRAEPGPPVRCQAFAAVLLVGRRRQVLQLFLQLLQQALLAAKYVNALHIHERCVNMSPYLNLPCECYLRIVWCGTIDFDALNDCTGVNSDPFISLHRLNSAHHRCPCNALHFPRAYLMRGHLKAATAAHLMGCLDPRTVRRAR